MWLFYLVVMDTGDILFGKVWFIEVQCNRLSHLLILRCLWLVILDYYVHTLLGEISSKCSQTGEISFWLVPSPKTAAGIDPKQTRNRDGDCCLCFKSTYWMSHMIRPTCKASTVTTYVINTILGTRFTKISLKYSTQKDTWGHLAAAYPEAQQPVCGDQVLAGTS